MAQYPRWIAWRATAVAVALLLATLPPASAQQAPESPTGWPAPSVPAEKHPKLDSRLAAAARAEGDYAATSALDAARGRGLDVVDSAVRVVVESGRDDTSGVRAAVVAAGGLVEGEYANLVQALVPPSALEGLASHPDVRQIRSPDRAQTYAVAGQGVGVTNAGAWHAAGLTGAGV